MGALIYTLIGLISMVLIFRACRVSWEKEHQKELEPEDLPGEELAMYVTVFVLGIIAWPLYLLVFLTFLAIFGGSKFKKKDEDD